MRKRHRFFRVLFGLVLIFVTAGVDLAGAEDGGLDFGVAGVYESTLEAQKVVVLSTEVEGIVKSANNIPQDFVKQGDVLIQLEDELVALRIEGIRAEIELNTALDEARISCDYAADNLKVVEELYNSEASDGSRAASPLQLKMAKREYEIALLRTKQAQSELKLLDVNLRQNEAMLRRHAICAPMDGVVVPFASLVKYRMENIKAVEVGEAVRPGQSVLAMMKVDYLRAPISLPVELMDAVQLGQDALVFVAVAGDDGIKGRVVYKSPWVEPVQVFYAVVEFANPVVGTVQSGKDGQVRKDGHGGYPYLVRPGMNATVQLLAGADSVADVAGAGRMAVAGVGESAVDEVVVIEEVEELEEQESN